MNEGERVKNERVSYSGNFAKQGIAVLAAATVFATPAGVLAVSPGAGNPDSSVARVIGEVDAATSYASGAAGRESVFAGPGNSGDDVGWD